MPLSQVELLHLELFAFLGLLHVYFSRRNRNKHTDLIDSLRRQAENAERLTCILLLLCVSFMGRTKDDDENE
jgi:hypothetical protein